MLLFLLLLLLLFQKLTACVVSCRFDRFGWLFRFCRLIRFRRLIRFGRFVRFRIYFLADICETQHENGRCTRSKTWPKHSQRSACVILLGWSETCPAIYSTVTFLNELSWDFSFFSVRCMNDVHLPFVNIIPEAIILRRDSINNPTCTNLKKRTKRRLVNISKLFTKIELKHLSWKLIISKTVHN